MDTMKRAAVVLALGGVIAAGLWLVGGRLASAPPSTPDAGAPEVQAAPRHVERTPADVEGRMALPHPSPLPDESQSTPPVSPLRLVDECLEATPSPAAQLACVAALDLRAVSALDIGNWACAQVAKDQRLQVVLGARLRQVAPTDVLGFIGEFQEACGKYAETSLTIGGLLYGRYLSEAWYLDVSSSVNVDSILLEGGSDAAVQLAEAFLQDGDGPITTLMQDIGTGVAGGSPKQVFRAALISLVNMQEPTARLTYLERVYATAGDGHGRLAHLFAEFLSSSRCWPEGRSTPALKFLSTILHDPRYGRDCAAQLRGLEERSIPESDQALWKEIVEHARLLRGQNR